MAYYFIHGAEETTSRTGRYPAPNPFHVTYPYDASDTDAFDTSIAQFVEDTCPQESHEVTATIPSSQSESDGDSSAPPQSQSDQTLNDEIVDAQSSLSAEETLSDPESVEERRLVTKENSHEACIEASFKLPSDKPSEIKICSPPPDRKQESEALGPGLPQYSQYLIVFKDPTVPSGTPGVSMSQVLKGDRGCVEMSDSVPEKLPANSSYIDIVFPAPRSRPQVIRIPIDCCHAKLKREKIRPRYYNLAYAISKGYKEILQREKSNRFPEKSWEGNLLPDVTDVCYLRLLCLYPIDEDRIIWGAEVKLVDFLAWFKKGRGSWSIVST